MLDYVWYEQTSNMIWINMNFGKNAHPDYWDKFLNTSVVTTYISHNNLKMAGINNVRNWTATVLKIFKVKSDALPDWSMGW